MAVISKQYTFDAAHLLPNHNGKCRNLHGHTYRVTVFANGPIEHTYADSPSYGMVIDYGDIDKIVKPIIAKLDHAYLNDLSSEDDLFQVPTAEHIALYILQHVERARGTRDAGLVSPWRVCVNETPSTSAEVTRADLREWITKGAFDTNV